MRPTLSELIRSIIARWPLEGSTAVEAVCREHPEHAAEIEREVQRLLRLGSLESMLGFPPDRPPPVAAPPPPAHVLLRLPHSLGRFRLEEELGRGAAGAVYRAIDLELDRDVAIKLLYDSGAFTEETNVRFRDEARMLAALDAESIARIHSFEREGDTPFIVMQYVEGTTLAEALSTGSPAPHELLRWGAEIGEALAVAHERGIVHCDLKPGNVIVDTRGRVKVVDFGIAEWRRKRGTESGHAPGLVRGTPLYMSPSLWDGATPTPPDDIWSLGCVLFEMFTGDPPFEGADRAAVREAVRVEAPDWTRLTEAAPAVVPLLVARCLDRDPTARPTPSETATILREAAQECGSRPTLTVLAPRRSVSSEEPIPLLVTVQQRGTETLRARLSICTDKHESDLIPAGEPWTISTGEKARRVVWCSPAAESDPFPLTAELRGDGGFEPIRVSLGTFSRRRRIPAASLPGRPDPPAIETPGEPRLPRVTCIVGDEGSGRSTLLDRGASHARRARVRDIVVRGESVLAQPVPALAGLLLGLLGFEGPERAAPEHRHEIARRLADFLGPDPAAIAYFLSVARDTDAPAVADEARRVYWERLLISVASDGPLWIAIDDLDRCDDDTQSFLEALIVRIRGGDSPIDWVVTLREAPPGSERDSLIPVLCSVVDQTVCLPPCDTALVRRLLERSRLGSTALDLHPWLPRVLLDVSGGSLGALDDCLAVVTEPEGDRVSHTRIAPALLSREFDEAAFRATLGERQPRHESRLDALAPGERQVLETIALAGDGAPLDLLQDLHGETVVDHLERLEDAGWLEPLPAGASLVRLARPTRVRAHLVPQRGPGRRERAERCLEIAQAAVRLHGDDPRRAAGIGELFLRGGALVRALERLSVAITDSLARGEYENARRSLEKAEGILEHAPSTPTRIQWMLENARTRLETVRGNLREALDSAGRALALAEHLADPLLESDSWLRLAEVQLRDKSPDAAGTSITHAETLGRDTHDVGLHRALLNFRGILAALEGDLAGAREAFTRLVEGARMSGDPAVEARALNNLAHVEMRRKDREAAATLWRRATHLAERIGNLDHATVSRVGLANIALTSGRLEEAEEEYERAIELQRSLQNRNALASTRTNRALVQLYRGRIDVARRSAEETRTLCRSIGALHHAARCGIVIAECDVRRGRLEEARGALRDARRSATEHGDANLELQVRLYEAWRAGSGAPPEAILSPVHPIASLCALQLLVSPEEEDPQSLLDAIGELLPRLAGVADAEIRLRLLCRGVSQGDAASIGGLLATLYEEIGGGSLAEGCEVHAAMLCHRRSVPPGAATYSEEEIEAQLQRQAMRIESPRVRAEYLAARRSEDFEGR